MTKPNLITIIPRTLFCILSRFPINTGLKFNFTSLELVDICSYPNEETKTVSIADTSLALYTSKSTEFIDVDIVGAVPPEKL